MSVRQHFPDPHRTISSAAKLYSRRIIATFPSVRMTSDPFPNAHDERLQTHAQSRGTRASPTARHGMKGLLPSVTRGTREICTTRMMTAHAIQTPTAAAGGSRQCLEGLSPFDAILDGSLSFD